MELYYSCNELDDLAYELDWKHGPFVWRPDGREAIQAEIDAAIMHLYGLDRSQSEWILDAFTVLRKYEERDYGEFRTKRFVLSAYDAIAKAKRLERAVFGLNRGGIPESGRF